MDEANETIPEPTKESSGYIKAIGKDSVHKICSGQVVLSLAVAVKELVENAIDAGATLVEVRLREQGLEMLEVSDNGSGVAQSDLEAMTAKYHTSKIREFVDLEGVETFGFRGEALSSLCALSDLQIVTRHQTADVGIKIDLDHEGNISRRVPCARSVGTTVKLTNLFDTLPVRKRDFTRNIKKEFTKMCQMLQAYCLVAKGVRIICTNQNAKGGKTVLMQTNGAHDVLANISAVFGNKQQTEVVPLKTPFGDGNHITAASLQADLSVNGDDVEMNSEDIGVLTVGQLQLEGYVSTCKHGAGRSSKDRQFFYVNNRPCDSKNIAKVVNEVYHRYNAQQFPFVYLNVITSRSEVDVNLAPDKRQLLIHNEQLILLLLRKCLLDTFGNVPSTYKLQNSIANVFGTEAKTNPVVDGTTEEIEVDTIPLSSSQRFSEVLSQWKRTGDTVGPAPRLPPKRKIPDEVEVRTLKLRKIQEYLSREAPETAQQHSYKSESDSGSDEEGKQAREAPETAQQHSYKSKSVSGSDEEGKQAADSSLINIHELKQQSADCSALMTDTTAVTIQRIDCKVQTPALENNVLSTIAFNPKTNNNDKSLEKVLKKAEVADDDNIELLSSSQGSGNALIELDDCGASHDESMHDIYTDGMHVSLEEIKLNVHTEEQLHKEQQNRYKLDRLRFKSEISPSQNSSAEAELQREISRESFANMEILGQFNKGFVIVKLDTDLFIVDQHATDEKYNFEMLQRTTTLQNQPLAIPQSLEMTVVNEMILLSHLDVFEKNGFKFDINETALPTQKIKLLARPFSRNWEFGKDDIDELIFMLQDAPEGTICRPSRIRAMFASRACRKSVMIGQALNKNTMRKLIAHMGEIEQPWNCPHGRPTMRHLINTAMLLDEEACATA